MIRFIKAFLKRSVTVERAVPNRDISYIKIDLADGSEPQELCLHRNDTFSMAWCFREFLNKEKVHGPIKNMSFTVSRISKETGEEISDTIKVPNWAKYKLYKQTIKIANEFGWDGSCPKPEPRTAYR